MTVGTVAFNDSGGLANVGDLDGDGNVTTPFTNVNATVFNGSNHPAGLGPLNTLSATYQSILGGAAFAAPADPATITLNNLLTTQEYEVQVWLHDSRNRAANDRDNKSGTVGGVTLDYNGNNEGAGNNNASSGGVGQYVIGTFTADAASQTFDIGGSNIQLNAIQLRATAVPEPSSFALLGGALACFAARHRRRRAKTTA